MNPFLFALLVALFTCAGSARAQDDAPSPSPYTLPNDVGLSSPETGHAAKDPTSKARVLYLKGNAAFKNDDLIIARDYYKKSLEIRESFDTFCNLGRAEELSELLDGAYYHLGLCLKYYPPDEELAAIGDKYARLHQDVAKRLSAEQVVALDMKISAHELNAGQDEEPSEAAIVTAPPVKQPVAKAQPSENPSRNSHAARTAVSVGLGVLGAAGVGVGVGFIVDAQNTRDKRSALVDRMNDQDISCTEDEDNHPSCALRDKLHDKAKSHQIIGIALTASGSVLLVGSTLLYFLWPQPKASGKTAANESSSRQLPRGWVQVGQVALRPEVQLWSPKGGTFWGLSGRF